MEILLKYYTPLVVCSDAIRTCWDSGDKSDKYYVNSCCGVPWDDIPDDYICPSCGMPCTSETMVLVPGEKDKELIDRVGNKYKHESVKRHLQYSFTVEGITTKTLLALSRYTVGINLSVQSSRYTCKKSKMGFTKTSNEKVNIAMNKIIEIINDVIKDGGSCDDISMLLPQSYQYNLSMTMNLQSLQHFIEQRLNKASHWDIQDLAINIVKAFPDDHFYLIEDIVKKEVDSNPRVKKELERYVS